MPIRSKFTDHSIELFRKGVRVASKQKVLIPMVKLFYVSLPVFYDLQYLIMIQFTKLLL
jgi:hypothetical protein